MPVLTEMATLTTGQAARVLARYGELRPGVDRPILGGCYDTRELEAGQLFVAFQGESADGNEYVEQAISMGAVAVICSRAIDGLPDDVTVLRTDEPMYALQELAGWWRRQCAVRVAGITGSVGKTTVKEVLAALCDGHFRVLKNAANRNNEIGLPVTLLGLTREHDLAVLEMGMYAEGEIARLVEIAAPEVGIVTNVGPAHLERLGSMEAIARAKSELPAGLPSDGAAILNADDAVVASMPSQARVVRYGEAEGAEVRAVNVRSAGLDGLRFDVQTPEDTFDIEVPLPGRHILHSVLAAVAGGLALGLTPMDIQAAAPDLRGLGRMQILRGINGSVLLDDTYNASPVSVIGALRLLAELPGRRIAVLGQMNELGAASEPGHREVGVWAARCCDLLITTGGEAALIAESATASGLRAVEALASKDEAFDLLQGLLAEGDHALFKASRGIELETILDGLRG
jgi:UDP-N-acetylmuramoyl-tripeptide--D-alanyl-D-alanine ligase